MIQEERDKYYQLTGPEFFTKLGVERPTLFERWSDLNVATGLRAIESHLLPWTHKCGQETHVLAWPDGSLMISRRIRQILWPDPEANV